eukprot:9482408-Pyramimonas_sp.AAC.1
MFEASWELSEAPWGSLEAEALGFPSAVRLLDTFRACLGPSWAALGASWASLGPSGTASGRPWALLELFGSGLGGLLGRLGASDSRRDQKANPPRLLKKSMFGLLGPSWECFWKRLEP